MRSAKSQCPPEADPPSEENNKYMADLTTLKRTGKKPYRRIGRGQGSKRGKQSGRGGKGQSARAGHKIRPAIRDLIKKLPKRRGYGKNRGRTVVPKTAMSIPLARLDAYFDAGEITKKALIAKGLIGRNTDMVKIVGGGETKKKFTLKGIATTSSVRAAIEKAGGSVASNS